MQHTRQEIELATAAQAPLVPARNGTGNILEVISRAASDPATDVTKLEKILEMYERVREHDSKVAYTRALAAMQAKLPVIRERGGINIGKGEPQKYALWEDINEAIKPILNEHGFAISFRTGRNGDKVTVTGVLSHEEGHSESTTLELPTDTSGSKNAVQAVGSSTSYGKRYTAIALLNLTSSGEDDDGKAGGNSGKVDDRQIEHIRTLITRTGADIEKFCRYMRVESIPDIPAKDYERAITSLNLKEKKINK